MLSAKCKEVVPTQMRPDQEQTLRVELLLSKAYELRGSDLTQSIALAKEALESSQQLKDLSLTGKSLSRLSLFYMINGEHQTSVELSQKAINCFEELDDDLGIADAKYNLGGVYYKTDNYHLGMVYLLDCLRIYKKHKDYHNESRTQKSLGAVYQILGDLNSAKEAYEGAIAAAISVQNKNLESNAYNPLSGILLKMNEVNEALTMIERSIAIKKQTGDIRGLAFAIYGRGKIHLHLQQFEQAEKDLYQSLDIHKKFQEHLGTAMALHKIALMWKMRGKVKKAKTILKSAIPFSDSHHLSLFIYKCNYLLYSIYKEEGKRRKALSYLEKYLEAKDNAINSQTLKIIENYELISRMKTLEQRATMEQQKAEIIIKQKEVEQSAQLRQEFLSAVSHEIRTPLNAVTSIVSLLEERSSDAEKELLTSLQFSAKNLMRIINDILDFSKLESNKMKLDKHPVAFKELLGNIHRTYDGLAREKGIDLVLNIRNDVYNYYSVDETKLFQILGNLISNAVKFTEEGSVTIEVANQKTNKHTDTICFKIIDTGVGIPDNEKTRLFESFYIPKSVMTRRDGGTGLGLAIVKKLVELHGSTINIDSVEGQGSNFYFNIKLARSSPPIKVNHKTSEKLVGKTAILAEDNEINALVMRRILEKWGMKIKRVANGKDATTISSTQKVDFILMDIHMPQLNGFDATKRIRTEENPNKLTPIFALTADITAINNEEYEKYFDGFLWKPLQIERLFETLVRISETEKSPIPYL